MYLLCSSLSKLFDLLDSPVSEVRDGVLNGCCACITPPPDESQTDTSAYAKLASTLQLHPFVLIGRLLRRLSVEPVPPVYRKTVHLIRLMSEYFHFNSLSIELQREFSASFEKVNFSFLTEK